MSKPKKFKIEGIGGAVHRCVAHSGTMRPCKKHPKYQAKLRPRCNCEACWALYLRERCTRTDKNNSTWLIIDHQAFELRLTLGDSDKENRAHSEWRRDQLAYALGRLVAKRNPERRPHPTI